jgi:hypothetical protein
MEVIDHDRHGKEFPLSHVDRLAQLFDEQLGLLDRQRDGRADHTCAGRIFEKREPAVERRIANVVDDSPRSLLIASPAIANISDETSRVARESCSIAGVRQEPVTSHDAPAGNKAN